MNILKQFIGADQVDDTKILLRNAQYLRARNAANSGNVNLLRLNASDIIEFASLPQYSGSNLATEAFVNARGVASYVPKALVTTNVTISNPGTAVFDSVTLTAGQLLFLAGQSTQTENGLWTFNTSSTALTRPAGWTTGVTVAEGTLIVVDHSAGAHSDQIWKIRDAAIIGTNNVISDLSSGSSSGANTSLSNLSAVAINSHLYPYADNAIDIGGSSLRFGTIYAIDARDSGGVPSVAIASRFLADSGNQNVVQWDSKTLNATGGAVSLNWQNRQLKIGALTVADWSSNATLKIVGDGTGSGRVQLNRFANDFSLTLQANDSMAADVYLIFPADDGTAGQVLTTDGAGTLSWASAGSGANTALSNLITTAINQDLIFDKGSTATLQTKDDPNTVYELVVAAGSAINSNGAKLTMRSGGSNLGTSGAVEISSSDQGDNNFVASGTVTLRSGDGAPSGANGSTGAIYIHSGIVQNDAASGNSGTVNIASGAVGAGAGQTGSLFIGTGNQGGNGDSGQLAFSTGSAQSTGQIAFDTGNPTAANFNSGAISFATGNTTGTGVSGAWIVQTGSAVGGDTGLIRLATGDTTTGARGIVELLSRKIYIRGGTADQGYETMILGRLGGNPSGVGYSIWSDAASAGNESVSLNMASGDGSAAGSSSGALNFSTGGADQASGQMTWSTGASTDLNSGGFVFTSGTGGTGGATGSFTVQLGTAQGSQNGGLVNLIGGNVVDGIGGQIAIQAGNATGTGTPGFVALQGGNAPNGVIGGAVQITGGAASTAKGGSVLIYGGDTSSGGQTGDVILKPGQVTGGGGTVGFIKWQSSNATVGYVLTATNVDGSADWAPASGGGANTFLSNLTSPTSINQNLEVDTNNTRDIGSRAANWNTVWTRNVAASAGDLAVGTLSTDGNPEAVAGRAVLIATDLNGLAADVDGGDITIRTNNITAAGAGTASTGAVAIYSGAQNSGGIGPTGDVSLGSGSTDGSLVASGKLWLTTGDTPGTSGDILIRTGIDGIRGKIQLQARYWDFAGDSTDQGNEQMRLGIVGGNPSGVGFALISHDATAGNTSTSIQLYSGSGSAAGSSSGGMLFASAGADINSGQIDINTGGSAGASNGTTGTIGINTGTVSTGSGVSGALSLSTGNAVDGNSGAFSFTSGAVSGTGNSGQWSHATGNASGVGQSGGMSLITGSALSGQSGSINIQTGNTTGGGPGGINLICGNDGSGNFGQVQVIGSFIDLAGYNAVRIVSADGSQPKALRFHAGNNATYVGLVAAATIGTSFELILPAADGTAGQALKTDGAGTLSFQNAGGTWQKQRIALSGTDITNQYIDLAHVAMTDSISFVVKGGNSVLIEGAGDDYSVSYTGGAGGNTRITFLNDIATGGPSALTSSNIVVVQYQY